jgi:hypothetical protein
VTTFKPGTTYYGWSNPPGEWEEAPTLDLRFSVFIGPPPPGAPLPSGVNPVTPAMIANTLNELLADNGWPPIEFLGAPVDERLNQLPS